MYPLERIKDMTPQKRAQLIGFGITSVEELARAFPRMYYDFRKVTPIKDLEYGKIYVVYGRVLQLSVGAKRNTLTIEDADGNRMFVTWFHTDYLFRQFRAGDTAYFCGKVTDYRMSWSMTNPMLVSRDDAGVPGIYPVYTKHKGMSEQYLKSAIASAIGFLEVNRKDFERDIFARELGLMDYIRALRVIHNPSDNVEYKEARKRMAFEDIYDFYAELKRREQYRISDSIGALKKFDIVSNFVKRQLPFSLTDGQLEVVRAIAAKCMQGKRINAIVSGDVGCGKTVVALISALMMAENGFQTVIAAPTLILATQHFSEMKNLTSGVAVDGHCLRLALLTSETKKSERNAILKAAASGKVDILIGTHAVFSPDVKFANLGMTIIDEEHKFGVEQKSVLEGHDREGVHHISMTATPIPRSIALTVYTADTAVLPIRTMPKGRKPVITKQYFDNKDAFDAIHREIRLGHQAYIVCPFIDESDNARFKDVASVASSELQLADYIKATPGFSPRVVSISGDMKQADVLANINLFATGQADILISTSIVEVGVNVPNATAICVMSAGRFGLASLHQLRGRVIRGCDQGYCFLVEKQKSEKLDVLCSTSNGFEIAEKDLELRGPGDLIGQEQSGESEVINTILSRPKLSALIKEKFFPPA